MDEIESVRELVGELVLHIEADTQKDPVIDNVTVWSNDCVKNETVEAVVLVVEGEGEALEKTVNNVREETKEAEGFKVSETEVVLLREETKDGEDWGEVEREMEGHAVAETVTNAAVSVASVVPEIEVVEVVVWVGVVVIQTEGVEEVLTEGVSPIRKVGEMVVVVQCEALPRKVKDTEGVWLTLEEKVAGSIVRVTLCEEDAQSEGEDERSIESVTP